MILYVLTYTDGEMDRFYNRVYTCGMLALEKYMEVVDELNAETEELHEVPSIDLESSADGYRFNFVYYKWDNDKGESSLHIDEGLISVWLRRTELKDK
jgi:hypothetical protein